MNLPFLFLVPTASPSPLPPPPFFLSYYCLLNFHHGLNGDRTVSIGTVKKFQEERFNEALRSFGRRNRKLFREK